MAAALINLLLVEDDPADARLAQETLKDYNVQNQLHICKDGESALAYLRQQGAFGSAAMPDMVLLDMQLPRMDGLEVLAEIRKEERLKSLPVVILTSSPLDLQIMKEFDVQADCVILKPLTIERYLDAVRCFPHIGLSLVRIASASV